jgi:hypothetical protein
MFENRLLRNVFRSRKVNSQKAAANCIVSCLAIYSLPNDSATQSRAIRKARYEKTQNGPTSFPQFY